MSRKMGRIGAVANRFEYMPGIPLVEICDQKRVLIENHQGLAVYRCDEIQINVRYGYIAVCGKNLKIVKMSKEKMVITGHICGVNLQGRE